MFYEIVDDVHWLMLTDVKHIKKSVLCAQDTFTNATYKQTADLSLYTWYLKMTRNINYVSFLASMSPFQHGRRD